MCQAHAEEGHSAAWHDKNANERKERTASSLLICLHRYFRPTADETVPPSIERFLLDGWDSMPSKTILYVV
jgi:hypothetical protein